MKRYVVKKYVMANSLAEALEAEKKVRAEDGWLDEKQPEEPTPKDQIGFELPQGEFYHSPYMKRKKKLTKKGKK